MARQGLVGRPTRRRFRCLTRPDKAAAPAPDLVKRDFTAPAINVKWCGDLTEVPTDEGKLYLAHVEDLASRRIPGFALSEHHDAAVAVAALQMAAAVRGGDVTGVIFHSDRGSEYTAELFETACAASRGAPVDGPGRIVFRQRGVGELPLDARVRTAPQTSLRHQGRGPGDGGRLRRPLQPDPSTQLLRDEATDRVRSNPRRQNGRNRHRRGGGVKTGLQDRLRAHATRSSGTRHRADDRLNQQSAALHDSGGGPVGLAPGLNGIEMKDPQHVEATGRRWMVSVFGNIAHRGSWPSGGRLSPVAVFGDIDFDFRQEGMPAGQVAINAVAPFGNIDVLVPDGVHVDVGGFTLFGSKKVAVGDATTNESVAVIRVRGLSLFGSVKVSS